MGGCCRKKPNSLKTAMLSGNPLESTDEANLYPKPNIDCVDSRGANLNYENNMKITKDDFNAIKLLGKGSFGKVLLVTRKYNNKLFAMKILNKALIRQKCQEDHTQTERILLEKIESPFVVSLYYAFQDEKQLYLVTEFMQGGDLFYHLHKNSCFTIERAKLYICEIILALEHLHSLNCIYRDLKPENVLLDNEGHVKLTDFGLSKITLKKKKGKAFTICGTPDYLAPEILSDEGYDKTVDWWSLGVLFYEMVTGISPFKIQNKVELDINHYRKKVVMPNNLPPALKSFLNKLIDVNPKKRLGYGPQGVTNIKNDPYFEDVDWDDVYAKKPIPIFKPVIADSMDISNFDKCFTNQNVNGTQRDELPASIQKHFEGFTYVKKSFEDKIEDELAEL